MAKYRLRTVAVAYVAAGSMIYDLVPATLAGETAPQDLRPANRRLSEAVREP